MYPSLSRFGKAQLLQKLWDYQIQILKSKMKIKSHPRKKISGGTTCIHKIRCKRRIRGTRLVANDDERRRRFKNKCLGFFGNAKTPKPQKGKWECGHSKGKGKGKGKFRCDPSKKTLDFLPLVGAGALMAVKDSYNLNKPLHTLGEMGSLTNF